MPRMIIVSRNGQTRVITGWRAWLLGCASLIVGWVALLVIASLVIGLSLSLGLILLLALPALAGAALLSGYLARRR
jgi:hypothetical protein